MTLYIFLSLGNMVALKRAVCLCGVCATPDLTAEAVQRASLTFQGVDDIHGCNSLPLGVLAVSDGIADDVLKKHFKDTACLLVDQTRYTFHTTSAS